MEKLLIECTLELFAAGAGRRHPGPRRRRALLRHLRAGQRRRRRHARRARPGAAARLHARARGDPDERVAGADDGGRRARRRRARSWRSARSGTSRPSSSARSPTPAASQIDWHGERVVDVPPRSVAHDGPTYQRPFARPDWQDALQADGAEALPRPATGDELRDDAAPARRLARTSATSRGSPTSTTATSSGNTVLAQPSRRRDGPRRRGDQPRRRGRRPTATAGSPSSTRTPARSSRSPRPTATSRTGGATPLAISDCLNFGSPEDPDVMWQFAEACRGLKDACLELGIPVTGGNVSLYNQTGETAILPTPVVAVLGVIDDVTPAYADRLRRRGRAGLPARRDPRGAVRLGVGARRPRPPRRAAAAGRPARREGARRAAARRRVGPADQRPRPLRRRAGAGAGRVGAAPRRRRHGLAAGRPVRRAVLRVGRPGDRDRRRRRRRRPR